MLLLSIASPSPDGPHRLPRARGRQGLSKTALFLVRQCTVDSWIERQGEFCLQSRPFRRARTWLRQRLNLAIFSSHSKVTGDRGVISAPIALAGASRFDLSFPESAGFLISTPHLVNPAVGPTPGHNWFEPGFQEIFIDDELFLSSSMPIGFWSSLQNLATSAGRCQE